MGYFNQRLATTISAQLIEWRLRGDEAIEGTVYLSRDGEYNDGETYIFIGVKLVHYKYAEGFWPDHWVASTNTGKHFFLAARDQHASVA